MSDPGSEQRTIDMFSDRQIQIEFKRRLACARAGNCSYCGHARAECGCAVHGQSGWCRGFDLEMGVMRFFE